MQTEQHTSKDAVTSARKLAIIRDVGFGCRDTDQPVLWFTTYVSESRSALQVLGLAAAGSLLARFRIQEVRDLEGQACWVLDNGGTLRFDGLCRID